MGAMRAIKSSPGGRRYGGDYCPYNVVRRTLARIFPFRLKPGTAGVASADCGSRD